MHLASSSPFSQASAGLAMMSHSLKTKKSHLVSLMPIFADLVLSNEASLKEHLRLILMDISEAIAENE
jgi:predicted protein tyrosine phosphatase